MKSIDKREENLKKLKELFTDVIIEVVEGYAENSNPIIGYGIDKDILQKEMSEKVV